MFLSFFKASSVGKNPFIDFYRNPIVVSCVFRALDDLCQALVLRLMKDDFTVSQANLILMMADNEPAKGKLSASLSLLKSLSIFWEKDSGPKHNKGYSLNDNFRSSLERYIARPQHLDWVTIPENIKEDQPMPLYNFLYDPKADIVRRVLTESKLIEFHSITKDGFSFVLEDVSTQICILLRGYVKYKNNLSLWEGILEISNLELGKAYKIKKEWNQDMIKDLVSFKFITMLTSEEGERFVCNNKIFRNFSFEEPTVDLSLKCDIIVETNFKIYAHVKPSLDSTNYQVLKKILGLFVTLDFEDTRIEELIVGTLLAPRVKEAYEKGISSDQILRFFRKHTDASRIQETRKKTQVVSKADQVYHEKRAKLKFLKIYNKAEDDILPNNVIQELRLWEEMKEWDRELDMDINDDESDIF